MFVFSYAISANGEHHEGSGIQVLSFAFADLVVYLPLLGLGLADVMTATIIIQALSP